MADSVVRGGRRVLVTGASDLIGQAVADRLAVEGVPVRALGETVETPPDAALGGVDAVFLTPNGAPRPELLARMAAAGVRRIVLLSSASAPWERAAPRANRYFLAWEQAVEATGVAWTHVRPAGLMAVTWEWIEELRRGDVVRHGFPAARYPYVHEQDVAAVAVTALLDDANAGARHLVTGPESIGAPERLSALAAALGRPLRLEQLTEQEAVARWRDQGWDEDSIDVELIVLRDNVDKPARPRRTVEKVLGRPALTFARWAHDHAADFR